MVYSKKTTKPLLFSILWHNLSKFITQMGLYCSKQWETTFYQFCEKALHTTFNSSPLIKSFFAKLPAWNLNSGNVAFTGVLAHYISRVTDDMKCIFVTCMCLCLSLWGHMPTLPWCVQCKRKAWAYVCLCVSATVCPHYCTDLDVRGGMVGGAP